MEKTIHKKDEQGRVRVSQMTPEEKGVLLDVKKKIEELIEKYGDPNRHKHRLVHADQ